MAPKPGDIHLPAQGQPPVALWRWIRGAGRSIGRCPTRRESIDKRKVDWPDLGACKAGYEDY